MLFVFGPSLVGYGHYLCYLVLAILVDMSSRLIFLPRFLRDINARMRLLCCQLCYGSSKN